MDGDSAGNYSPASNAEPPETPILAPTGAKTFENFGGQIRKRKK